MKKKKTILYVGNYLSAHGMNPNFNIFLVAKLQEEYKMITASGKKNKGLRFLDMLWSLYSKRKEIDLVIIDVFSSSAFYFALAIAGLSRKLKIPYFNILRGGDLPSRLKKNPDLSFRIFGNAAANISPSHYLEESFRDSKYEVIYIPNFISIEEYKFRHRISARPLILWVRSMHKIYNPTLAVKMLKLLVDKNIDAYLCMVGPDKDGSLKDVIALADELGVNKRLTLTGRLSLKEWTSLADSYDIFVNTTNFDNHPLSVIQAMALGFPIISTNVGGIPFLIDDMKDGILVPPGDVEALVGKILDLIQNPALTSRLSQKARHSAEQFDWKEVKQKWIEVIDNVI